MKVLPRFLYLFAFLGMASPRRWPSTGRCILRCRPILMRAVIMGGVLGAAGLVHRKAWGVSLVLLPIGAYMMFRIVLPPGGRRPRGERGLPLLHQRLRHRRRPVRGQVLPARPRRRGRAAAAHGHHRLRPDRGGLVHGPQPAAAHTRAWRWRCCCWASASPWTTFPGCWRRPWSSWCWRPACWSCREAWSGARGGCATPSPACWWVGPERRWPCSCSGRPRRRPPPPGRTGAPGTPSTRAAPSTRSTGCRTIRNCSIPQNNAVIMRVESSKPAYWRANALDEFTGDAWISSQSFIQNVERTSDAGGFVYTIPAADPAPPGRRSPRRSASGRSTPTTSSPAETRVRSPSAKR